MFIIRLTLVLLCVGRLCCQLVEPDNRGPSEVTNVDEVSGTEEHSSVLTSSHAKDDAIHPTSASTSHILQTSQHGKETSQGSDQSKTSTETFRNIQQSHIEPSFLPVSETSHVTVETDHVTQSTTVIQSQSVLQTSQVSKDVLHSGPSDATRQSEVSLTQQVHPKATDDVRSEVKDSQSESESQGQDEVIQDTNTQHQDILLTNGADPVKSDEHVETKQELKEDTPVQADLPDLSEDKSKVAELEGNVHTDHDEVALKKAHLEEPDKKLLEEEPSTEQAETKEDDFADKVKDNEAEEVKEAKLEEVKTTTHTPETPEEAELRGIGGREIKEEDSGEEKGEEVGLTFNEWTQKILAEAEKGKQEEEDADAVPHPPAKQRKKKNFSSQDCGAKILAHNPEASNVKSVLNSNKDDYMNTPCKFKKWFVLELCEPIQAHSVEVASLELFSSQPKKVKVLLSDRYPTKDWQSAGEFETRDERAVQNFTINKLQDYYAKYVRVEITEHFGHEHFCPLTIFRVLGVSVDYDDEVLHHGNTDDDDNDDDPDESEGQNGGETKNLFESAKDTVLGIVKKVLNVEQHEEDSKNVTGTNLADPLSGGQQNISTSTPPAETTTLPCPPDAKIPGELPVTPPTPGDLETQLPQPPEPGKANLVRKLDEDEQIETSTLIPLDTLPGKPLKHHLQKCMETSDKFATKLSTTSSFFNSSLCRFAFIVFQTSPAIKDEENIKVKPLNMSSSQCENGSPKTETKKQSSLSETTKISSSQSTVISVSSKVKDIRETESVPTATSMESSKSETKETTQSKVVEIEPTKISDNLPQSGTTKLSSSTSTTDKNGHIDQTGSSSEQVHIDPSPTSVAIETGSRVDQSIGATPSLPPSWAPETKDVGKETVSTDGNQPHVDTSATGNSYQPDTMTVGIDVQEALTDIKASTVVMTTSDITKPAEVAVENGDMDDIVDDIRHEETSQQPNTIVIDDKVVIDKGTRPSRGDNLDIVRVPIVSSSKRESAIMRLSNRIKVLEQNVSLSSRFLEELSRRYKKQSEDMMKMLNKTMARLTNLTIENDVKNKIHEDEMLVMERRLENLTGVITSLNQNFDRLNKQVTDRQMIWTTIEIMVIVSMLIFFHLRRQQPASLPPEVKSLIENMPSKPGANPLVRRNSISGPVTPSKKIVDTLQTGGALQRFCSETALASSYDTNDGIGVNPKQVVDGFKKKKKKKHKGSDPKLFYSYGGQPPGELIPESTPEMVQTKSEPGRTSSFASIFRNWGSSGTSKPRSGSLGTDDRIGCNTDRLRSASAIEPKENKGTKSKNPQLNVGLKGSASSSCRLGNRNDNEFVIDDRKPPKGHRRQKSLPKQHYSSIIETVGNQTFAPISNGSQSVSSECNPVSKKAPKKGDLKKSASMPSESAKSRKEPSKSASGQMVNGYHHNGFEEFDNNIQNSHTRTAFGKSHSYTSCVDRGHLKDFGVRENDSVCTPTKYSVDGFVNGYHGDDYDGDVFKSSGSFESCSPRVDLIKGDSDSPSENKRSWKNMFLF
ncbi:SUN domain-containing ossification factor-like isoform X3 [Mya arenaria]|uniref:SUN domain-containing ossification factor-like isoform X3 n=1 Tax=Mya arenaria TaxID=6604 RepID=UPI0022DFE364|nr:SUN domain-containing ossification factor-like isoform X3 [Mya arenaria]